MEVEGALDSTEKGASSESVEQRNGTNSDLKPETVARRMRRRKQREHEQADKEKREKAAEAERIANAETQEEPEGMSTPAPKVRRPTPTTSVAARRSTSSTMNQREEPYHIADDYPSQVGSTLDDEVVVDSPPLQRTRASSGLTDNNHVHNLFDGSQDDLGVRISIPNS